MIQPAPQHIFNGITFVYRGNDLTIQLSSDKDIELYLNGCLRKSCPKTEGIVQYVWTNIELEWEEHHYLEARYWRSECRLEVTVNRKPLFIANLVTNPDKLFLGD